MNIILRGLICHLYVTQSYFREIKPVNLKRSQPWILIGRTDAEAETPVFWSSDANSWLTGKVPDAGKDWGQEKRVSEYEMAGWHHQCNRHELGQTLGNGEGQGGLACCSPWGHKELDTTGRLNNKNISLKDGGKKSSCVQNQCFWLWEIILGHFLLSYDRKSFILNYFKFVCLHTIIVNEICLI